MALHVTLVAGMLMAGLAGSAAAQPDLYIAQYQFNNAKMAAVRVDGTNPRELFAIPAQYWLPIGLAYVPATGRLIWMDSAGASNVVSANVNGSGLAAGANVPGFCKGASLDAQGRVYFGSDNKVMRCNPDGSGLVTLYTSPTTTNPVGAPKVDATNGHVYFGDAGFIRRMDLDGGNRKVVLGGISQARCIDLDIEHGYIFWADADTISDHIMRARLDSVEQRVLLIDASPNVVQSPGLIDLVVTPVPGRIFWADELQHRVFSSAWDGSDQRIIFTSTGDATPSGLALSTPIVQPVMDCNGNGVPDDIDIAAGAADCDNNGVPDSCQSNPCPVRTFLLNQGSDAANSQGRALGEPSNWQAFQPFDVTEGWGPIGEVGLDGCTVNYADGSGFRVTIFGDDGSGNFPDESWVYYNANGQFRFNTNYENWVYHPIDGGLRLAPGRYWLQLRSETGHTYQAIINHGFSGLGAKSRGSSGNFTAAGRPIALRLTAYEAPSCPADFNGDGFVDFFDADAFVACFEGGACPPGKTADFNGDGFVDFFDADAFVEAFEAGC